MHKLMTIKIRSISTSSQMTFCCTVDVVTKPLPKNEKVRFPENRKKLLKIAEEDQLERSSSNFFTSDKNTAVAIKLREDKRADEVLRIMDQIKTPTARNIGIDGSRAVWLIALHNMEYRGLGRRVLKKMRQIYYRNPNEVFYPGIPYLADRLAIVSGKYSHDTKQLYGTQNWFVRDDKGKSKSGRYPIKDKVNLPKRLRKFGISDSKKCEHSV